MHRSYIGLHAALSRQRSRFDPASVRSRSSATPFCWYRGEAGADARAPRRAVRLLFAGKAEALHRGGGPWHAETLAIELPSVIRMLNYIKHRRRRVALTKKNILLRDNYTCAYCGGYGDTVDHVIPRSKGGPSSWENTCCSCMRCNGRKGDRTPEQAQMKLRIRPRVPQYIPFIVVRRHTAPDEWAKYLTLYNVSIDERIA